MRDGDCATVRDAFGTVEKRLAQFQAALGAMRYER